MTAVPSTGTVSGRLNTEIDECVQSLDEFYRDTSSECTGMKQLSAIMNLCNICEQLCLLQIHGNQSTPKKPQFLGEIAPKLVDLRVSLSWHSTLEQQFSANNALACGFQGFRYWNEIPEMIQKLKALKD